MIYTYAREVCCWAIAIVVGSVLVSVYWAHEIAEGFNFRFDGLDLQYGPTFQIIFPRPSAGEAALASASDPCLPRDYRLLSCTQWPNHEMAPPPRVRTSSAYIIPRDVGP